MTINTSPIVLAITANSLDELTSLNFTALG